MATVKFYKTIFRFNLFNLPRDHLHKLISPLSIEFIRMELRLHYVCIPMYCDCHWFNVAITTTGRLGFLLFLEKWRKCKYLHSQICPLAKGLLRTRISSLFIYLYICINRGPHARRIGILALVNSVQQKLIWNWFDLIAKTNVFFPKRNIMFWETKECILENKTSLYYYG